MANENKRHIVYVIGGFILFVVTSVFIMVLVYRKGANTLSSDLGGPTQFGQFGDYVGGLLNPIFGFLTVCLLIYTASISQRQAKETADELKLSKQEYDRKQLEPLLKDLYQLHDDLLNAEYQIYNTNLGLLSIKSALMADRENSSKNLKDVVADWRLQQCKNATLSNAFYQMEINVLRIAELTLDILTLTNLNSLKMYWLTQTDVRMMQLEEIGILDFQRLNEFRMQFHQIQNQKLKKGH